MAANPEVVTFIQEAVSQGVARDDIYQSLKSGGWSHNDITDAFAYYDSLCQTAQSSTLSSEKQQDRSTVGQPTPVPESPVRLRGVGDLLGEAASTFTELFAPLYSLAVIPVIVSTLLSTQLLPYLNTRFLVGAENGAVAGLTAFFGLFLLVAIALSIIQAVVTISVVDVVSNRAQDISVKGSLEKVGKKLPSVVWVSLLVALISIGGFLFFLIPGMYLSVALSFAIFVVLDGQERGLDALHRSRHLVRRFWSAVVWRTFLGTLILQVVSGGVLFLVGIVMSTLFNTLSLSPDVEVVLDALVSGSVTAAITVVQVLYLRLIYKNLVAIKANESIRPMSSLDRFIYFCLIATSLLFGLSLVLLSGA